MPKSTSALQKPPAVGLLPPTSDSACGLWRAAMHADTPDDGVGVDRRTTARITTEMRAAEIP